MNAGLARHTVVPGKTDDSVSLYLRKPLRKSEGVRRGKIGRTERPALKKGAAGSGDSGRSNPSSKSEDRS